MALWALAVLVPLVVVLLVLVHVVGQGADSSADGPVADVSGPTTSARDALPPVQVDTPAVTPAADLACPVLMSQLPLDLADESSRMVQSASPYAYAWGDPPVVLICGVAPAAGYVVGSQGIVINGVEWYVDTTDPDTVVWTTVDRNVPVQMRVPSTTDSALVTAASTIISAAIPYTDPTPAPG